MLLCRVALPSRCWTRWIHISCSTTPQRSRRRSSLLCSMSHLARTCECMCSSSLSGAHASLCLPACTFAAPMLRRPGARVDCIGCTRCTLWCALHQVPSFLPPTSKVQCLDRCAIGSQFSSLNMQGAGRLAGSIQCHAAAAFIDPRGAARAAACLRRHP